MSFISLCDIIKKKHTDMIIMKTLFLTDLDGTLLNSNAELSAYSRRHLNKMLSDGLLFTVATARTNATVLKLFNGVDLNLPFILMNGVILYDPVKKENIKTFSIEHNDVTKILDIYNKYNKTPMLYLLRSDYMEILYEAVYNEHQQKYIDARDSLRYKRFKKYNGPLHLESDDKVVYLVSLDEEDILSPIYKDIVSSSAVNCAFYKDNYTNCNFMECMNKNVSKGVAANELKQILGVDKIIAYGDNLNDLPMFRVADESYAVSNACEELKKAASGIIESNDNDGVIKHIASKFYQGEHYGQTL